ncbi:hypothetical protein BAUCODRAFT_62777 [Baudoinia panamericana UAMH 10762]|uniref:Uncharacterized protein n=1 Tax=Baudoinia panamericana (strain UAMH 10762) TaxID=717646 RepID=M2NKS8_BAUPA|nr:uncharacterized protein BAUCODRAFT_62777 [Baudoinia panamericana UAMH 10762]EMD00050.1 hypothetical protein BAUCODRAFT_62777 [Baudoinia panamericana UAMH 10762]
MNIDVMSGGRSVSPTSSGRSSPVPRATRRAVEDEIYKADKGLRRYGVLVERAVSSWETAPREWADYIAFLGRLLKAIQSHPKDIPVLPHTPAVASKLAQCLNPALPSGVHQKALEVYTYIFSTFSLAYLSDHLSDYFPGLAPVLSFASLTVRPVVYSLYENYIARLSNAVLRPALKALILSLLPPLEDETAEDFERAVSILDSLKDKFSKADDDGALAGFYWQSVFLCVITSVSRRQGALNYLVRRLPSFAPRHMNLTTDDDSIFTADGNVSVLSAEAQAAVSPEPGLLLRCFASGLADSNPLVQRGYLDLLVAKLPLHSVVIRQLAELKDSDRLTAAATYILLRRDMSLNRRLWSWFLGPAAKVSDVASPGTASNDTPVAADDPTSQQIKYFEQYARSLLERCVLGLLQSADVSAAQKARPFRICVSLMDRWEIGGTLLPSIFPTAMNALYAYGKVSSASDVEEVLRSASIFFDGIEANLVWQSFCALIQSAFQTSTIDPEPLMLVVWVLEHFNVNDEEMINVHGPMALALLTSLLSQSLDAPSGSGDGGLAALRLATHLAELGSQTALRASPAPTGEESLTHREPEDLQESVGKYYERAVRSAWRVPAPIDNATLAAVTLRFIASFTARVLRHNEEQIIHASVTLLMIEQGRTHSVDGAVFDELFQVVENRLASSGEEAGDTVAFPILSSITSVLLSPVSRLPENITITTRSIRSLIAKLWSHLSHSKPKYHVEAVRHLWRINDTVASEDILNVALLELLQLDFPPAGFNFGNPSASKTEAVRRFTVLWDHSIPSQATAHATGVTRRGSSLWNVPDATQLIQRLRSLREPMLRILDTVHDVGYPAFGVTTRWLGQLPSLARVFAILFQQLHDSFGLYLEHNARESRHDRTGEDTERSLAYALTLFTDLLSHGSEWTWDCLTSNHTDSSEQAANGVSELVHVCVKLLARKPQPSKQLDLKAIALLKSIMTSSAASKENTLEIDGALIDRMMLCLREEDDILQGAILPLITAALRLRFGTETVASQGEDSHRRSLSTQQASISAAKTERPNGIHAPNIAPPAQLLQCLQMAFSSSAARLRLNEWVEFLATVLPLYGDAIFASLIPLVETLCRELSKAFEELVVLSRQHIPPSTVSPDVTIIGLLEGLDLTLARAHRCLVTDDMSDEAPRMGAPTQSFLGGVAAGVFKATGPPSKTTQANSRLTVILALQDAAKINLTMWAWCNDGSVVANYDRNSAATAHYWTQRVRNKCRFLLEQMFSAELLESVEVVIKQWRTASRDEEAAAAITLLQALQASTPRYVLPAILDSICSRANPSALPASRLSTQTIDLAGSDIAVFLLAYVDAIEDDAMDEVWPECLAFLRDVLANPLPYRQVMAPLLALIHMLARKVGNTNFGDQRKMRRELADNFQRLLAATFTTTPSGNVLKEAQADVEQEAQEVTTVPIRHQSMTLTAVLRRVVPDLSTILEYPDKISAAFNAITTNLLSPPIHAKGFPTNMSAEYCKLLLQVARELPTSKAWKKDVTDAFNDPKLLASGVRQMQDAWLPILHQWTVRDHDQMSELLARLTPPSSAGIMFGVGANAARLEADRKTQLNLRRMCLLLLASPVNTWVAYLHDFDEKLVALFTASPTSSPSSAAKADLFLLCEALILAFTPIHLSPLWPTINENLQHALTDIVGGHPTKPALNNLGLLQACKFLDMLIALSPEEFQLHEWLYISDTIDAVYQPIDRISSALVEEIADALAKEDSGQSQVPSSELANNTSKTIPGRLLLANFSLETADLKAMPKDDFAITVLRPFLNQLSMYAYDGVYAMETVNSEACRHSLLKDLLDLSTIVE